MAEDNQTPSQEFNSFRGTWQRIAETWSNIINSEFTDFEIQQIIEDPITYHWSARRISNILYNKNGIVSNTIDYLAALPRLDRVINCRQYGGNIFGKLTESISKKKIAAYKATMDEILTQINDKSFIRDALFTEMKDGICFYYFEPVVDVKEDAPYLSEYDISNTFELNVRDGQAAIITLPYEQTRIINCSSSGAYELAFNLKQFEQLNSSRRKYRLKQMPKEIRDAYAKASSKGTKPIGENCWYRINKNNTICCKIKAKRNEYWGRPLALSAIIDILYQDKFVDTKRNTLDELNNRIVYQTLPEGKEKGKSSLTSAQQEAQHEKVKDAVMNKNNRGGTSFFTVAAGTKIDTVDISSDILDSKNETNLNDQISLGLGIAGSLLNGSGSGNYSSQQNNLELISAQVFAWVEEIQKELNRVLNACVIKDRKYYAEAYYLPTSLVNSSRFFDQMKSLYLDAGGSMTMLIASTGVSPEIYYALLNDEYENNIYEKFKPHQTSYTLSSKGNTSDDVGGRPVVENPTSPTTISGKANGSNSGVRPGTR